MMHREFIPNSFQVPNAVVDALMLQLSGNAFKCYLLIVRKTTGWGKSSDKISISQFMSYTGIKKRDTVISCLLELERLELIVSCRNIGKVNEYFLNQLAHTHPENRDNPEKETRHEKGDWGRPENGDTTDPENGDTQINTITKTTKTKLNNRLLDGKPTTKNSGMGELSLLTHHGVDEQTAQDYLTVRQMKKSILTLTALNSIVREASKANLTVQQVITICVERNWIGFNASWIQKDQRYAYTQPKSGNTVKDIPIHTQSGSARIEDYL